MLLRVHTLCLILAINEAVLAINEASIKQRLLAQYGHSSMRPAAAAAAASASCAPPDRVRTQFYLDRYADDSLSQQSYGMDGYLRSFWVDPRLAYDGSTIANGSVSSEAACPRKLGFTREESRSVWRPQFYWEGALTVTLPKEDMMVDGGAGELFEVSPDGSVFWSQQVSLQLACTLQLQDLPFDTQKCRYRMGLYSHTADEVRDSVYVKQHARSSSPPAQRSFRTQPPVVCRRCNSNGVLATKVSHSGTRPA